MGKELYELSDLLCGDAAKLVTKEVKKIVDKDNLTPAELDCLEKAAIFMEKSAKGCGMIDGQMDQGESYGGNYRMNMRGHYDNMHYEDPRMSPMDGYSERRTKSPVTGRYISRGMDGMSGHSVEDRMIMALEEQMDGCKTEYERQKIEDEIRRLRMGNR